MAAITGRDGPAIYTTWSEASKKVLGFPGAKHKGFPTYSEAQEWLGIAFTGNGVLASREEIPERATKPSDLPSSSPIIPHAPFHPLPLGIERSKRSESWDDYVPLDDFNTSELSESEGPLGPPHGLSSPSLPPPPPPPPPVPLSPPIIELSDEQNQILQDVLAGQSLFFTGSAGTGKSVLLREIIEALKNAGRRVAVTASTGIAGVNIGGATLHSFAGIGLGKEQTDKLVDKVKANKNARNRWCQTSTLVIDEISMIDGMLFDKIEAVARGAREDDRPFGGIQLVLCGDFYQLPPVPQRHDGHQLPIQFAFEAYKWKECVPRIVVLTQVFRQKDQRFVDILNDMRLGTLTAEAIQEFHELRREVTYKDGLQPTELYPTREQVDAANNKRMKELPLPEQVFIARDYPGYDIRGNIVSRQDTTKLLDRLIAQSTLRLRVGAQVMLIQNMAQDRLVNGSIGRVIKFKSVAEAVADPEVELAKVDEKRAVQNGISAKSENYSGDTCWPVVEFENGKTLVLPPVGFSVVNVFGGMEAQRDQVPLIQAWALSIHKSQGQTLGRVKVDLGKIFEKGQAYVAISRATSLQTLQILNFDPGRVQAHHRVLQWSNDIGIPMSSQVAATHTSPVSTNSPQPTIQHDGDEWDESWIADDYHAGTKQPPKTGQKSSRT